MFDRSHARTSTAALALSAFIHALSGAASAQLQEVVHWEGGIGSWNDPLMWNTGIVPANSPATTWRVLSASGAVGLGSVITCSSADRTVDTLRVALFDTVRMTSGTLCIVGQTDGLGNTGLGGGTLQFINITLDNTGGMMRAADESVINFQQDAVIIAGDMTTESSGEIRVTSTTHLHETLLNGHMVINNNTNTTLHGVVTHTGVIDVNSAGNATNILLNTPEVTFTGGGVMNLSNSIQNRVPSTEYSPLGTQNSELGTSF